MMFVAIARYPCDAYERYNKQHKRRFFMRIIILVLLLMTSSVALAERMFDGFYASAGYTYFKNESRILEGEVEFSEWVPKVSLGYGKSSKLIRDTN